MKNPDLAPSYYPKYIISFLFLILISSQSFGQEGIRLNTPGAFDGYKLCNVDFSKTYLIDNCGEIVNTWNQTSPQYYCKLTEEGHLIFISNNRIYERDWNNNSVNIINLNSTNLYLDYEVLKLENGNFLAASRRFRNAQYFDDIGWDSNKPKPNKTDGVVEIDPDGNIVWEWNFGDHTIQDKRPSASNFGIVEDHPELADINAISDYDWQIDESFMINSIDYNNDLDQILISVRKMSEIMVIDHSTTTEEASGSIGGNSGKGGDILYRWGNPQNYDQGNESNRVLYFQHNPNWVKFGEHKGKIIVFNNGLSHFVPGVGSMSSVHILNPPIDQNNNYLIENGAAFAPETSDVTIDKITTGNLFFSPYTSGAQVLPNGNIFITVGQDHNLIEVETDGDLVWDYNLPGTLFLFRTEQYSRDFPGFKGRDMSANGTIESPSSAYNCNLFTSTNNIPNLDLFTITYDQKSNNLTILNLPSMDNILEIRNSHGQLIQTFLNAKANEHISFSTYPVGLYFVSLFDKSENTRSTNKIVKY